MTHYSDPFGTTPQPRQRKKTVGKPDALCLTILAHPDVGRIGDRCLVLKGHAPLPIDRNEPDFTRLGLQLGRPLNDPFVSRTPIHLEWDGTGPATLRRGNSQMDVLCGDRALGLTATFPHAALAKGIPIVLADRVVLLLRQTVAIDDITKEDHGILGFSDGIQRVRREVLRVADLKTPILLRGSSGTGKELVAKAIHALGKPNRPFVSVNMAAIPPELAISELFGAEKGSFTGADRHQPGLFRQAHGGTLFLDEVGDTPAPVQVALLRALETGEIMPVGSQRAIPVNVKLIAATDADLEALMEEDSFKKALFHRLTGYEIHLPSLRARLDDLGYLFLHFAREDLAETGELHRLDVDDPYADAWLPASLMLCLLHYHWPGNVRQLRNIVRQLIIANRGRTQLAAPERMLRLLAQVPQEEKLDFGANEQDARRPNELSSEEIIEVMRVNRWDIKASAKMLGIARGSLYSLIKNSDQLRTAADLTLDQIEESRRFHKGNIDAMIDALRVSEPALRRRAKELNLDLSI